MVQIQFRVGAHLEEQFESEFGVSWSCGELLGCSVAHTSLYLYIFYISVFRQDILYVRVVFLVSDLLRILEALVLMTPILG